MFYLIYFNLTEGGIIFSFFFTAHAVMRKWVLLTDPDDKMAGVKVKKKCLVYMYMLWFNFILGLNFISLCFGVW